MLAEGPVLEEKLNELFARVAGGPNQPPVPTSILVAEPELVEGQWLVRERDLLTPPEYDARFVEILASNLAWVNLNYSGLLRGHGLVLVEYPKSPARHANAQTSVNYSGPSRLVADAGWDARVYVTLVP